MTDRSHRLVQDLMERNDGWAGGPANESALEYDYMTRHLTMSVIFLSWSGTAIVIGSVGNIFIIGAVLSYKRLSKNTTNMFILNLAVADLVVTAITNPAHVINVVKGPRIYVDRENLCYVLASLCMFGCIGSMLFICTIAVNSICICKPYAYQSLFTKKRTMLYCGLIWFTTSLLDSPNWVGWSGYHFQLKEMLCGVDDKVSHAYLVIRSVAALGIPVVIVFVCYLSIYLRVRKAHTTLQKVYQKDMNGRPTGNHRKANILPVQKEDMQLAITLFATFVIFMVSWSPYMFIVAVDTKNLWPKELYVISVAMGHANSMFNSFTYGVCNPNFRRGYYVFLLRFFRRKANDTMNSSSVVHKEKSTVATIGK